MFAHESWRAIRFVDSHWNRTRRFMGFVEMCRCEQYLRSSLFIVCCLLCNFALYKFMLLWNVCIMWLLRRNMILDFFFNFYDWGCSKISCKSLWNIQCVIHLKDIVGRVVVLLGISCDETYGTFTFTCRNQSDLSNSSQNIFWRF